MKLHTLKPAKGATHKEKRIGRGEASGKGGTSTKGNKGGQSRAGYKSKKAHEGGQMPIQRRLPKRGTFTLLLVFIYRVGSFIVLPGIDPNKLAALNESAQSGMLGLLDTFVGGAFSKASIFALGIMPYISASIFMQLMTILVPQMAKIQKEGESGRKKINQWTRYLTVIVTAFQAAAYIGYLKSPGNVEAIIPAFSAYFWVSTVIILTVGTLFVMWLGEKITDKGLGNGTSIII
ncbi:MAG: 50S ribosomal protein L15 [Chitinophagaceae bacterium]|nr:50S ribosomal protein L15 [Chitinophagaceae bacterium]